VLFCGASSCTREESEGSSTSAGRVGGVLFRTGFLGGSSGVNSFGTIGLTYLLSPLGEMAFAGWVGGGNVTMLPAEGRETVGGLRGALSGDVPDEDVEAARPEVTRNPAAIGDTDFRFSGTTLLGVLASESQSERFPIFDDLLRTSDGDRDDTDDGEALCIDRDFARKTSAHCPPDDTGVL
jgi:hypothetical protein